MSEQVKMDAISDTSTGEWCLHLLEDGPWSIEPSELVTQLRPIQTRIYLAVQAALYGQVARMYPESQGAKFRVQINSPSGCPPRLQRLVTFIDGVVKSHDDYTKDIGPDTFVSGMRIVTGNQLGWRF